MTEEQPNDKEPVFTILMTVGGDVFGKFFEMDQAIATWQEVAGTTNDEIELHTIH